MQNVYVINDDQKLIKPDNKNIILVNNDLFNFELNDGDIFISFLHETPLNVRLEYFNIPYNSLVITTKNINLTEILEETYIEDYPIFSGNKMEVSKKETKISILKSFKLLVNVMYQMLDAGYLESKNYKKIEDWILSFEHPILKLFKVYHKFEIIDNTQPSNCLIVGTSNQSIDFEEEFTINPQFRQMLLITLMKIISNFIINNQMITIQEVSELGDWTDINVWKELKKKVKLFK